MIVANIVEDYAPFDIHFTTVQPANGRYSRIRFLPTDDTSGDNAGDLFRLGDGDGDGRLDLFYGRPTGMTSLSEPPDLTKIQWYGRRSLGTSFGDVSTWRIDAGDEGDLFR